MKNKQVIFDCKTRESMIIEVEEVLETDFVHAQETTTEQRVLELENIVQEQNELINTTMLATDEMFMMLEPLLAEVYALQGGESKMVDMYVAMVQRGLKTIDQVPARYREQVQEILAQLEA